MRAPLPAQRSIRVGRPGLFTQVSSRRTLETLRASRSTTAPASRYPVSTLISNTISPVPILARLWCPQDAKAGRLASGWLRALRPVLITCSRPQHEPDHCRPGALWRRPAMSCTNPISCLGRSCMTYRHRSAVWPLAVVQAPRTVVRRTSGKRDVIVVPELRLSRSTTWRGVRSGHRVLAVPLDHQPGGAVDVEVGDHCQRTVRR